MHVAFVQPFGIGAPGGGARILRALLKDAPVPWTSFCTHPEAPPKIGFGHEEHIPKRPWFGRIERTRFGWVPGKLEPFFSRRFERKLKEGLRKCGATSVHLIPHGLDFVHGYKLARRLGLAVFFNVHDDVVESFGNHPGGQAALEAMPEIWSHADARFVISDPMGREYNARYGSRNFVVVTDGLERISEPRPRVPGKLRIYFMGLFHIRYEANLAALLRAIELVRSENPRIEISATFRCGSIRSSVIGGFRGMQVLPFGSEADVEADMKSADLLYMPLPFREEDSDFVRFSLSTKMITYLGCGIPILYHGPREAAAHELLSESNAAFISSSLEPESLAAVLREVIADPGNAGARVQGAMELATRRFMLEEQRRRFWSTVQASECGVRAAVGTKGGGSAA
jgi:glycosyltransferase involved in cell wall biosynthesis